VKGDFQLTHQLCCIPHHPPLLAINKNLFIIAYKLFIGTPVVTMESGPVPLFFIYMVDTDEIKRRVEDLTEPALRDMDKELVMVEYRREQVGWVLRLYVDRLGEAGISVDELVEVSRTIGPLLEAEDIIRLPYRLEVSSPGLDRPLPRLTDCERFTGKNAAITTLEGIGGRKHFRGIIKGREGDAVLLLEGEAVHRIPWKIVKKANLKEELTGVN